MPITRKAKPNPDGTYNESKDLPPVFQRVVLKYAEIAYIAVKYDEPGGDSSTVPAGSPSGQTNSTTSPAPPPTTLPVPGPTGP